MPRAAWSVALAAVAAARRLRRELVHPELGRDDRVVGRVRRNVAKRHDVVLVVALGVGARKVRVGGEDHEAAAVVVLTVLGTAAAARAPEKPNILYLMAGAPAHWPTLLS